jgi:WD40 repeat protein
MDNIKEESFEQILKEPIDERQKDKRNSDLKIIAENINDNANIEGLESKIIEAKYNFDRKFTQVPKYHKKYIIYNPRAINTSLFQSDTKTLITGSDDGYIKLYDYKNNKVKRMFNICNFPIITMSALNNTNIIAVSYQ